MFVYNGLLNALVFSNFFPPEIPKLSKISSSTGHTCLPFILLGNVLGELHVGFDDLQRNDLQDVITTIL